MSRRLLVLLTLLTVVSLLAGCPAATPQVVEKEVVVEKPVPQTVVVEKEVIVEKPVVETVVVEKEVVVEKIVTPTPVPKPAVFRVAGGWTAPPGYHGNRFAPGGVGAAWWWVFEPLFHFLPGPRELFLVLAESYEETEDALTVKLRQDAFWHDGTPFTSKDVWSSLYLRYLQGATVWKFLDTIETPDDYTVVFKWKEPALFAKELIASELIAAPYHIYGKWADQVPDAMGDEEAEKKIMEDLATFRPELPIGTGPFKVTTVTASEMILDKFPQHPKAENIHFERVRVTPWSSNEVVWAFLIAGELDAAHPASLKDVADQILAKQPKMSLALPTDWAEFSILFNMRRKPFDELNVRKAIAHAIDRKQLREVTYFFAGPVEDYAHGVLKSFEDKWLSKEFLDKLTLYDYDPSKSEALLTEIGYKRGPDGIWETPEGVDFTIEVNAPARYSDWVLACENVATQLTDFGIPTECRPIDNPVYWPALTAGEYDIAIGWYATWWRFYHPWAGFERFAFGDGAKRTGLYDNPVMPLPDGTTINIQDMVVELGTTFELDKQRELVEKLAWAMNENLPAFPFMEKRLMMFHNAARVTGWPPLDSDWWLLGGGGIERFYVVLMLQGMLKPVP